MIIGPKNGKDLRVFLDKKVELLKDEEFDPSVSDEKKEEVKKIFQELVAQNERWSANRAAWVKAVTTSSIARSASSASAEALVPPNKRGKKGK